MRLFGRTVPVSSSCAQIHGPHMVLSLMTARRPAVWQRTVAALSSAAFEVTPLSAGGVSLCMVTKDSVPEIIAEFDSRDDAVVALADIQRALSHGGNETGHQGSSVRGTFALAIIAFVLLVGLSALFFSVILPPAETLEQADKAAASAALGDDNGTANQIGIPQNADDVLGD